MVGEEPDSQIDPADIPISFSHKHVFKRILIVAAGPIFNLLLAVIIFFGIFQISGTFILKPSIGKIEEGTPAHREGLKENDLIVAIDGSPVSSWDEMAETIISSRGKTLKLLVRRGETTFEINITPELKTTRNIFGEDIKRYMIGIAASGNVFIKELNPFQAFWASITQTYNITKLTLITVGKLIQGKISAKTLGGPIMIAQMAGQQAKQGATNLLFFIALISINLAILNFLPIPVLDGGHLLFFFIEVIIRHPVNTKMREIAQQAGIFILILLMIYVFYNDIARVFFR
jgi:regulator of sigma E protease